MFVSTSILLLLFSSTSLAQCISSAEEYINHFRDVLAGSEPDPSTCVDTDLMVSIQYQSKQYDISPTLNFRNGSWSWASGWDNLETYLRMAEKHRNDDDQGLELTHEMINWVGIPGTVDTESIYNLAVFSRALMTESAFDDLPVMPSWPNLWNYLANPAGIVLCSNWTHDLAECPLALPIEFTEEVKVALETDTLVNFEAITGCPTDPPPPNTEDCICTNTDYCSMKAQLWTARATGTYSCVTSFSETPGATENAAQTRAFFEFCMGCNYLFSGNGTGYNGQMFTGEEWLVRGNVPLVDVGAVRLQLYPQQ